jgi:hypothetical protein
MAPTQRHTIAECGHYCRLALFWFAAGRIHHLPQPTRKSPARKDRTRRGNCAPCGFRGEWGFLRLPETVLVSDCALAVRVVERIRAKPTPARPPVTDGAVRTSSETSIQQFERVTSSVHTLFVLMGLAAVAVSAIHSFIAKVKRRNRIGCSFMWSRWRGNGFSSATSIGGSGATGSPSEASPAKVVTRPRISFSISPLVSVSGCGVFRSEYRSQAHSRDGNHGGRAQACSTGIVRVDSLDCRLRHGRHLGRNFSRLPATPVSSLDPQRTSRRASRGRCCLVPGTSIKAGNRRSSPASMA